MSSRVSKQNSTSLLQRVPVKARILILLSAVFVFLAAAVTVSVRTLMTADDMSREAEILELVVAERDSIAETLKVADGDMQAASELLRSHKAAEVGDNSLTLYYNSRLVPSSKGDCRYEAIVTKTDQTGCHIYTIEFYKLSEGGKTDEKPFCDLTFSAPDAGTGN